MQNTHYPYLYVRHEYLRQVPSGDLNNEQTLNSPRRRRAKIQKISRMRNVVVTSVELSRTFVDPATPTGVRTKTRFTLT